MTVAIASASSYFPLMVLVIHNIGGIERGVVHFVYIDI
jgi:hypothetical protein